MVPLIETIGMLMEAGMEQVRAKNIDQACFLEELAEAFLYPLGFSLGSPSDKLQRGSHISLRHPEAFRISQALIDPEVGNFQVIPDFREPDNIRLGITPLYTTYEEIFNAVQEIRIILKENLYKGIPNERGAVT
jgi:kynureninase